MRLRLVFSFSSVDLLLLCCYPMCVAFRIGICSVFGHLSTFCTCQLGLAFVFQLSAGFFLGGRGGGG